MKHCINCKLELSDQNWHRARAKKRHYICNICAKQYLAQYYNKNFKVIRARSIETYKSTSFAVGSNNWAQRRLAGYRSRDRKKNRLSICDFSVVEFLNLIKNPCIYCNESVKLRTIDRIDNSKGHSKDNVVVACIDCNSFRSRKFTVEEMKLIGKTIEKIKMSWVTRAV